MKPTFDQILRLIVCFAGIIFFGVGIWMVKTGIAAQGVIDIQLREVLSGRLETGSAGLFIVFLAFFLIVAAFLIGRHPVPTKPKVVQSKSSKLSDMVVVLIILWAVAIVATILACEMPNHQIASLLGMFAFIVYSFALKLSYTTYERWMKEPEQADK